jgi:type VI secretion system protein ImpJ
LIKRTPDKVKIASSNDIQKLVSLALPGLKLRHVSPPPDSIPMKSESQYFALHQAGAVWGGIARSRSICIVPADIPDAKLEILVVSD